MKAVIFLCTLSLFVSVSLSASNFEVGDVDFPAMKWGDQKVMINVTGLSEDYGFVLAETEIRFLGDVFVSPRFFRNSFIFEPLSSARLELPLEIPGNFGSGVTRISLYDVVDTLDQPLESQRFFEKEHKFDIDTPVQLKAVIDSGIQVPAFVDQTDAFDNLFSRMLVLLLHRGRSLDEIASACNTELDVVKSIASRLAESGYLKPVDTGFESNFAVIENDDISTLKQVIDLTIDSLYEIIARNLPAYDSTLRAMADAGTLTKDSNDLLDGGSVLYHTHPVIMGLLLWDILGKDFVNDGVQFSIFDQPESSEANMGNFMHMVVGDVHQIGKTFYYYINDPKGERFYCGGYGSVRSFHRHTDITGSFPVNLLFASGHPPLYFSYNEDKLRIPLSNLMDGTSEFIVRLKHEVGSAFYAKDMLRFIRGIRYWCWNLIVSDLMDRFEENGVLERENAGVYVFQKVDY